MPQPCYICRTATIETRDAGNMVTAVTCCSCGGYRITQKLIASDKQGAMLDDEQRLRLRYRIRTATDELGGLIEPLTTDNVRSIADSTRLPTASERFDILVSYIARVAEPGSTSKLERWDSWAARIALRNPERFATVVSLARDLVTATETDLAGQRTALMLTYDGLRRADALQRRSGEGNRVFVAMWFHDGMANAYDHGIALALADTGHIPYRADREAHHNRIDDQVIAELRRSKFIVSEVTGARSNVYFEAGYALGFGIPVIWCCNSSWSAQTLVDLSPDCSSQPEVASRNWTDLVAFDTRQFTHIFWKEPDDLRQQLATRIRALGLDPLWNR
jgi:hypothetical protein